MRRLLLNAAFVLVLASCGWGQMRGGRVGGGIARPGFAARPSVGLNRGAAYGGYRHSGVVVRTVPSNRSNYYHRYYNRHHYRLSYPYGYYAGYGGYYGYAPYYGGYYGGYYPFSDSYSLAYGSTENDGETQQLYSEINRLSNEVASLREEQEARAYPPQPPAPPSPPPAPEPRNAAPAEPTTFVFRDHHSERVQNYAIVGQTLWIFDEHKARKVALSEIDVAATQKANEDSGVFFPAVGSR